MDAVHGNVDAGTPLARRFPASRQILIEDVLIHMTHYGGQPAALARALPQPKPDVYIFGHSHVALLETLSGVLFLNPGAAGRPRFGGGLSVAILDVEAGRAEARIVPLVIIGKAHSYFDPRSELAKHMRATNNLLSKLIAAARRRCAA